MSMKLWNLTIICWKRGGLEPPSTPLGTLLGQELKSCESWSQTTINQPTILHQRGDRILRKALPGVNFTNILRAAFTHKNPKSSKKTVKSSSVLRFWDLRIKTEHKHVDEIDPKSQCYTKLCFYSFSKSHY